jgi:serine/threonine-protein kinase
MNAPARLTSRSVWTVTPRDDAPAGSGLRSATGTTAATIGGKYLLQNLIGEGGMGTVWRAHNTQLDVPVAIKLLRPGLRTRELAERLRLEGRAVAKLLHPNVVRMLDAGETDADEPFLVMELLQGESLSAALSRGRLPAVEVVQLLLPIADALALAHSRGVVHRDIKPDNVFLAVENGALRPKLLDFGIAQVAGCATDDAEQGVTQMGSPQYMSPEQVRGEDTDLRTDVWSFCVLLYEALSGARPFSCAGGGCSQLLRRILHDEPPQLEVFGDIDSELSEIVQRGLAKNRAERYSSIREVGRMLVDWLAERGQPSDPSLSSLATMRWGHLNDVPAVNDSTSPSTEEQRPTLASPTCPDPPKVDSSVATPYPPAEREPAFALDTPPATLVSAWAPAFAAEPPGRLGIIEEQR